MLYVVFSITQIIIDIFKSLYNTAFLKFVVMIVFTVALNLLCQMGLGVVSWFIVFVPFIMMTIITSLLLFVMGLSPSRGRNRVKVDHPDREHEARDHEEARHRRAEERIHNHEARLREQTHHWREERRHEEERHQQEKRYLEHRRNQPRSRRLDPYDYHDGHHHNNDVLYEEFDGYNTDGSDMLEYHEIRPVHARA
jgi:uncharacterized membrane protein